MYWNMYLYQFVFGFVYAYLHFLSYYFWLKIIKFKARINCKAHFPEMAFAFSRPEKGIGYILIIYLSIAFILRWREDKRQENSSPPSVSYAILTAWLKIMRRVCSVCVCVGGSKCLRSWKVSTTFQVHEHGLKCAHTQAALNSFWICICLCFSLQFWKDFEKIFKDFLHIRLYIHVHIHTEWRELVLVLYVPPHSHSLFRLE